LRHFLVVLDGEAGSTGEVADLCESRGLPSGAPAFALQSGEEIFKLFMTGLHGGAHCGGAVTSTVGTFTFVSVGLTSEREGLPKKDANPGSFIGGDSTFTEGSTETI
jgi:hypothetical protein